MRLQVRRPVHCCVLLADLCCYKNLCCLQICVATMQVLPLPDGSAQLGLAA